MKGARNKFLAVFLTLIFSFSLCTSAFAYEESVSSKTPVGNYQIWSELYKDGSRYNATTWVQAKSGNIPANGVQVQAFLYDGHGDVESSSLSTLTTAYYFHVASTGYTYMEAGSVYSQGMVYIQSDDGSYTSHQTTRAREENLARSTSQLDPIRVNESGETYGSLMMANTVAEIPDWIAAVGTEGQRGYVLREDLLAPDSRCGDESYGGKHISLYDDSGSVIGVFEITFSCTDMEGNDIDSVREQIASGSEEEQELWALADEVLVDGKYPVNDKGQSYGNEILRDLVGYTPDLIQVENVNGRAGYIHGRKEIPISAEDLAKLSTATSEPLYDQNGNVIGTYEWNSNEPLEIAGKSDEQIRDEIGEEAQIAYAALSENELAYCNVDEAPETWKAEILEARNAIIHSESWTVDGQCAVLHEDGTIEELPEFADLFPGWDVPASESKQAMNTRGVNGVNYVGYVYLRHPGTEFTKPFYTFFPSVSKTIEMGVESFDGTSWNARYDNISTGKEVGHKIELPLTSVFLLKNPNTDYAYGAGASTYSNEGEALMYVTYQ